MTHKQLVKMVIHCKVCMKMIYKHLASQAGTVKSKKKAASSRRSGKLGGRLRIK